MRRRKMQVIAGMPQEPALDEWCFVSGVIVQHQMNLKLGRHLRIGVVQKLFEFNGAMPPEALANDIPCIVPNLSRCSRPCFIPKGGHATISNKAVAPKNPP